MMQLVELIRGIATGATRSRGFIRAWRTSPSDFPAFIVNRILLPMINEAVYTLYEGVGTVESTSSKAMRLGANHPMGPLELAMRLDTCLSVMQVLYEGLANSKYRPCPLLVKDVEAGCGLGRKTQRRFCYQHGQVGLALRQAGLERAPALAAVARLVDADPAVRRHAVDVRDQRDDERAVRVVGGIMASGKPKSEGSPLSVPMSIQLSPASSER